MGHGSDKLYITHGEHMSGDHGASSTGAKAKKSAAGFQRCALSLKTVDTPVITAEGDLFELLAIIPWIREHGTNPVTGKPLVPGDLIKVHFFFNSDGHEHDPATFKVFNEHTPLVVIKTTGNVYSRETIDLLNIKPKHWNDLMTEVPFTRDDIITLQDPLNVQNRDFSKFDHVKKDLKVPSSSSSAAPVSKPKVGAVTAATLPEVKKTLTKAPVPYNTSIVSSGRTAASLTSTSATIQTTTENALWNEEDLMFEAIQAKGDKAFVRLVTNFGNLNLELYCDKAPKTCYNFLKLAMEDKYKETIFHRCIPGFMLQGGDPTGTGRGGSSWWGAPFEDEYNLRNAAKHDDRGVLSMANSGPNTNSSQFFLTFRATPHLDLKHTVFGRLVGGDDVLSKIERVPVDPATNRPLKPVILKDVAIFGNPYADYQTKLEKRIAREKEAGANAEKRAEKQKARDSDRTTWFGTNLGVVGAPKVDTIGMASSSGIGKYVGQPTTNGSMKRKEDAVVEPGVGGKKQKKAGGFSDFSAW